jgi:CxxC motif-containing protein (DUF1111 family)
MRRLFLVAWRWLATAAAICLLAVAAQAAGPLEGMIREGGKLFEFEFSPGMGAKPGADGLGPMFNHVSCAGCHKQGGIGGGGPVDVNAEMLSAVLPPAASRPKKGTKTQSEHLASLRKIHPAFVTEDAEFTPNLVLHRFSSDHRYGVLREQLTGKKSPFNPSPEERALLQRELARTPLSDAKPSPGFQPREFQLLLTQRNTPALFGAGIIDAIPAHTLHELARAQQNGRISGRVPPVDSRRAGRFGWRGQTEHLRDFVLAACANELGLEVPGVEQPLVPHNAAYRAPAEDLTEQQCNMLVAFVASLPPPKIVWPEGEAKRQIAIEGQKKFKQVGCVQCHVEEVGPAKAIYSDLLLHDLGPALADPVLARPAVRQASSVQPPAMPGRQSRHGSYGGGFAPQSPLTARQSSGLQISSKLQFLPEDLSQEWRTPPLWGVADSAPYLHDGRAETLLEAIAWHGGEARHSTEQFFALPAPERMKVLEFLACLKAP